MQEPVPHRQCGIHKSHGLKNLKVPHTQFGSTIRECLGFYMHPIGMKHTSVNAWLRIHVMHSIAFAEFRQFVTMPSVRYSPARSRASIHKHWCRILCDPMCGRRIGEAAQPGPESKKDQLTIAVCNPATIRGSKDDILNLEADLICVSETSATSAVQKEFQHSLTPHKYDIHWGKPVNSKFLTKDDRFALRGDAMGAAVITRLPNRVYRGTIPEELWATCRISAAIVKILDREVFILSIYGYAKKYKEGRRINDLLLAGLFDIVSTCGLPDIVGGDFNEQPTDLPAFEAFRRVGACEINQWFKQKFGYELPATCKNATRNDTFIFHHSLLPLINRVQVCSDLTMDVHAPMIVTLNCQRYFPIKYGWKIPHSWHQFKLDKDVLEKQYHILVNKYQLDNSIQDPQQDVEDVLHLWSKTVENAVDNTMQACHKKDAILFPTPGLPLRCQGRCEERTLQPIAIAKAPKTDKYTNYDPPHEVFMIRTKQKVRQVRRIRALQRLIINGNKKFPNIMNWPIQLREQALHEWTVIRNAQGYTKSWERWLLGFECIEHIPHHVPTQEFLQTAAQITEHDSRAACRFEEDNRKQKFKYKIQIDTQDGHGRQVYSMIKGQQPKPLKSIPTSITTHATLCRLRSSVQKLVISPQRTFQMYAHAKFGDATIQVLNQDGDKLQFKLISGILPTSGTLVQQSFAYTSEEVRVEFEKYWQPIWERDTIQESKQLQCWETFLHLMENVNFPKYDFHILLQEDWIWENTIKRLKNGKAHGACGWRAEEFKLLPKQAICHLRRIVVEKIFPEGLPYSMMKARVVLLEKTIAPRGIADGRPITILSALFRLITKVIADQALCQLSKHLPPEISGGLPGRGAKDLSIVQSFLIEQSLNNNTVIGGYTLDLVKAYNYIPRAPLQYLMERIGIPSAVCRFWFSSLANLTRYPQINGSLGMPVASTSGVPEGDACSVLGMVILSTLYAASIRTNETTPFCYVDNWSWMTTNFPSQQDSFQQTLDLTASMRMVIDHGKSWAWSTCKIFRSKCQKLNELLPDGSPPVTIKTHVKDLGTQIQYNKQPILGSQRERVDKAVIRCDKLKWVPITLEQKARMIQTAIWPVACYSTDTIVLGKKHIDALRRGATRAMLGDYKQASAFVACSCISPSLQDPLVYIVMHLLRTIRRFYHTNPEFASKFIQQACAFDDSYAFGPAGALVLYLAKLGWSIRMDGTLCGPFALLIDLKHQSPKEICRIIKKAWIKIFYEAIAHRKGIESDHVDFESTAVVYQQLPVTTQTTIIMNLVGGYQTGTIKSLWRSGDDEFCPFCGLPDTRPHRILYCPCVKQCRDIHPEAIKIISEERPGWTYLPLATYHEDVALLDLITQSRKFPDPLNQYDFIHPNLPCHSPPILRFYTDGSCKHPNIPQARLATWAIIQDICPNDEVRARLSQYATDIHQTFDMLRVLAVGSLHGPQNSARAELAAVTYLSNNLSLVISQAGAEIGTDSQYVIDTIDLIENSDSIDISYKLANYDLIAQLQRSWNKDKYKVFKVKAHVEIQNIHNPLTRWHSIPNDLADRTAKSTLDHDHETSSLSDLIADHVQCERARLTVVYKYLLDLNLERIAHEKHEHVTAKAQQFFGVQPNPDTSNQGQIFDSTGASVQEHIFNQIFCQLVNWCPVNCAALEIPDISIEMARACSLGPSMAFQLIEWLKTLLWPVAGQEPDEHEYCDPGISYFELCVNFGIVAQRLLPIPIDPKERHVKYIEYDSNGALLLPPKSRAANNQVFAMEKVIRQLSNFLKQDLIPRYPQAHKKPCTSLTKLGFTTKVAGIPRRPIIPCQKQTMELVRTYLDTLSEKQSLEKPLVIPYQTPLIPRPLLPDLSPRSRYNAVSCFRRHNK